MHVLGGSPGKKNLSDWDHVQEGGIFTYKTFLAGGVGALQPCSGGQKHWHDTQPGSVGWKVSPAGLAVLRPTGGTFTGAREPCGPQHPI